LGPVTGSERNDSQLIARVRSLSAEAKSRSRRAQDLAELIRKATGCRWVGIYTVEDEMVVNEAWSGPKPPAHPTFSAGQGLTAHALTAHAPALSNSVAIDPRYLSNQDESGSELIVPVLAAGKPCGTLESDRIGAFHGAEVARYDLLADSIIGLWTG
jgi:putative methionine-R-sulfoxide reductase with GAF domain